MMNMKTLLPPTKKLTDKPSEEIIYVRLEIL